MCDVVSVVGFPDGVTDGANVQIFHVVVVVSEEHNFVSYRVGGGIGGVRRRRGGMRRAQLIRTGDVADTRQCRVVFGVLVYDMMKFALVFAEIGAQHGLSRCLFFFVATISAIIHQFVWLQTVNARVILVLTNGTKLHRIEMTE